MCQWCCWMLLLLAVTAVAIKQNPLQADAIIKAVNAANSTWKAGRNFHPSLQKGYSRNLFGLVQKPTKYLTPAIINIEEYENEEYLDFRYLPKNFDARKKWPYCSSIQEPRDQGSCGSCWAVSAASAFSDRLCIATKGKFNRQLSAQQLLSCCYECGSACQGGSPEEAWVYFQETGIVSGGDFGSEEGCQPYLFPPCEHHVSGPRNNCSEDYDSVKNPVCDLECTNNRKIKRDDLHKVEYAFRASASEFTPLKQGVFENAIKAELYHNGPLTATFLVYEDFLAYKSGVYQYTVGELVYGHAVKVIGWGVEENTPYWLVANSWNSDWGDGGFFKIRRGTNECGFEGDFFGGKPKV